jgi:anaphase-promoting complex subunit 3
METYSTLLWHLGDAPALSHLSQELMAIDRQAPQPWIAAGNAFSLAKDHEEAMRCFRRATQCEPGMAYAWVLCGFEAVEMEEYERGLGYFRCAVRSDSESSQGRGRGYHAWYVMILYHPQI